MGMGGREFFNQQIYRFGFNGMEQLSKCSPHENNYDFKSRIYSSKFGRFFSIDPMQNSYPNLGPYNSFACNPILIVDIDGKENIIYVVNVPNGKGDYIIDDSKVQSIIDQANNNIHSKETFGLKTKYVLFDPTKSGGEINKKFLDATDAIILVGNVEQVKAYDRKNGLTPETYLNRKAGSEGWKGNDANNPETTFSEGKAIGVGYIDVSAITDSKNQINSEYGGFLMNHSTGHMADEFKYNIGVDPHRNSIGGEIVPNIMMNYDKAQLFMNLQRGNNIQDLITSKNHLNDLFKSEMTNHFGNDPANDNYQRNQSAKTSTSKCEVVDW